VRLIATLAALAGALLLTVDAEAKFTCQERGTSPDGIALAGLPARPVVGHTYRITVALPGHGPNPTPYLGAQYCGEGGERAAAGEDGWFRRAAQPGTFFTHLRFSRPGHWALSFMDLDGTFHDFGIRRAAARGTRVTDDDALGTDPLPAVGSTGTPALVWLAVGGACLTVGAGLLFSSRRKQAG
jgi:hypothetical protein